MTLECPSMSIEPIADERPDGLGRFASMNEIDVSSRELAIGLIARSTHPIRFFDRRWGSETVLCPGDHKKGEVKRFEGDPVIDPSIGRSVGHSIGSREDIEEDLNCGGLEGFAEVFAKKL